MHGVALRFALAQLALVLPEVAAEVLKIGGVIQETGAAADASLALNLWKTWAIDNEATNGYSVDMTLFAYNASAVSSQVHSMTTPSSSELVHAVICPYSSSASMACVDSVHADFTGPIIVWGGASSTIFDSHCVGKNCFGFLTLASEYMYSGMAAIDHQMFSVTQIAVLVYKDAFSDSVAAGVNATLLTMPGMALQSYTVFSDEYHLNDADLMLIRQAMVLRPCMVIIIGQDTVDAVMAIGKGRYSPKAVLATNSISHPDLLASSDLQYLQGVMMPTQWAENGYVVDPVVGWNTGAFKLALGTHATYQAASAGAVGIALANAMASSSSQANRADNLANLMRALDIDSFYGKIKFRADGSIEKHMYTQQLQNQEHYIVAPALAMNSALHYPLTRYWPTIIRVGGMLQTTAPASYASAALELWMQWVISSQPGYSTDATQLVAYSLSLLSAKIRALTDPLSVELVDVLICPYTTAATKLCVDAVADGFVGPIIVWGAAADSIFTSNCIGKTCIGFNTLASSYFESGIAAVDYTMEALANVTVVVNSDAFSLSVAAAVNASLTERPGMALQSYVALSANTVSEWTFKFNGCARDASTDGPAAGRESHGNKTFAECAALCTGSCNGFEVNGCTDDKLCNGGCHTFAQNSNTITNGDCVSDGSQKTYVRSSQADFACVDGFACHWPSYVENTQWRYQSQEATPLSSCQSQCASASDCTGIESPADGSYCAFWLAGSCNVGSAEKNVGWNADTTEVTCTKKATLAASDLDLINDAMALQPDVAIVIGHDKEVVPAIVRIGEHGHHPKAIIATNSITSNAEADYVDMAKYMQCVMMPTQWAETPDVKDPIVGWTSQAFKAALGAQATYHAAAAGAVGVAIANAMAGAGDANVRRMHLTANLKALDVPSFFGDIKFEANGVISKPMYTQQKQADAAVIVAPASASTGTMHYPLSSPMCWGPPPTLPPPPTTTTTSTSSTTITTTISLMVPNTTKVFIPVPIPSTTSKIKLNASTTMAARNVTNTTRNVTLPPVFVSTTQMAKNTSPQVVSTTIANRSANSTAPPLPTTTRQPSTTPAALPTPAPLPIPDFIFVEAPNGPQRVAGYYELLKNEDEIYGRPIWKHQYESRWIYLMSNGEWGVGGPAELANDFGSNGAYVFCGELPGSRTPPELDCIWKRYEGGWIPDPDIIFRNVSAPVPTEAPFVPTVPPRATLPPTTQAAEVYHALSSYLTAPVKVGDVALPIASQSGFQVGRWVVVDEGTVREEVYEVSGFGSILLKTPLKHSHTAGTIVTQLPQETPPKAWSVTTTDAVPDHHQTVSDHNEATNATSTGPVIQAMVTSSARSQRSVMAAVALQIVAVLCFSSP